MREILVKISDKLDSEGKHDLADAVDQLLVTGSRPKAPLKNLDDEVKKDLLKFIHNVKGNIETSMESLQEFFRRLRYFDKGEAVKDLKLDKALKELSRTHECMDSAGKTFYALTYGKYPSKSDMDQLADDFGAPKKETQSPLEFFENQAPSAKQDFTEREVDMAEERKDEDSENNLAFFNSYNRTPEETKELSPGKEYDEDESPAYHGFEDEELVDEDELNRFWAGDDEENDLEEK